MTTQVFVASTAFGLATLTAALEDGLFDAADRRVLVLSTNAAVPEAAVAVTEVAGVDRLAARFDAVHDYNQLIAPQHPSLWRPRAADLPLLERMVRRSWDLEGDVHLVVECVWTAPSLTLCRIFADARVDVYADGLMSYGPTRDTIPAQVACRLERLLHLDLVPGLVPVLLTEFGVPAQTISSESFRTVVATLDPPPAAVADAPARSVAVVLGQYLAALDLVSAEEEATLVRAMVRHTAAAGFTRMVVKPHPGAPPAHGAQLQHEAARLGVELTFVDGPALVEAWFRSPSVGLVVGCFSTALMTASSLYDLPAARVGTELLMERLKPYENSNRVPLTVVDAWLPDLTRSVVPGPAARGEVAIGALVRAVSYCMQPERYPALRPGAEAFLRTHWPVLGRYFRRRRLTLLDLPGRLPAPVVVEVPPAPVPAPVPGWEQAARRALRPVRRRV
ncbi:polysialyltransferase family glycosyltransferase, partial [Microlunatus capsulatus]